MVPYQLSDSGDCSTCHSAPTDLQILECYDCQNKFHADCGNNGYCCKSFAKSFKGIRNNTNFLFVCDKCIIRRENNEASSTREQLAAVIETLAILKEDVKDLKNARSDRVPVVDLQINDCSTTVNGESKCDNENRNNTSNIISDKSASVWSDDKRTEEMKNKMKITLCIKNKDGVAVDSDKVKNIITSNGIQVNKASVNKSNGDLYVDFPSNESKDKLLPLLTEETLPGNKIIDVKPKLPTISIRGVSDYTTAEDFIERVMNQNPKIKENVENGEFSVVFTKKHRRRNSADEETNQEEHQVVERMSNNIRSVIKSNKDKIYLGFTSHHVVDRFYIKTCSRCHKFGHYYENCSMRPCCGYCSSEDHDSLTCPIREAKDQSQYKCRNCEEAGKESVGHSSHWPKCPTYLEKQTKVRDRIPYYSKNGRSRDCQENV